MLPQPERGADGSVAIKARDRRQAAELVKRTVWMAGRDNPATECPYYIIGWALAGNDDAQTVGRVPVRDATRLVLMGRPDPSQDWDLRQVDLPTYPYEQWRDAAPADDFTAEADGSVLVTATTAGRLRLVDRSTIGRHPLPSDLPGGHTIPADMLPAPELDEQTMYMLRIGAAMLIVPSAINR